MNISIYPKTQIEQLWQEDKKRLAADSETAPICLRCGKPLDCRLTLNALSRHANVYVCNECGTDEALRDAARELLPMRAWYAVTSNRIGLLSLESSALVPFCTFEYLYKGPKKLFPLNSIKHPVSEVAYSRSDYNGRRWWRTWFHSSDEKVDPSLSMEIDQFSNALMELPEFKSLASMRQMCRSCAQSSGSPTDFNLFSETEHFYIWLQLVTREGDYNLYVHFYLKAQIY